MLPPEAVLDPACSHRPRIAVIDDDRDLRQMVSVLLQHQGFATDTYRDGLNALETAVERPDLILLDYMMPNLGGPEFLRARKSNALLSGAPVVMISAYPDLADTVRAETVGLVLKPLDLEVLLECVQYHCRSSLM